jgi:GT2 family glycosyltransferase
MTEFPNQAGGMRYSVVIATCDREEELARVLADWAAQAEKPEKVVVVEARGERHEAREERGTRGQEARGRGQETTEGVCPEAVSQSLGSVGRCFSGKVEDGEDGRGREARGARREVGLSLVELTADERSAAKQRNIGAEEVETAWIVFCDDDVRFGPDLAERTLGFLDEHPEAAAVFPRMRGSGHPVPGNWLRRYYRFQAGFDDETFGAKLFGAGLSCYPCWEKQTAPVEANWLPSTMLWMKTDLFKRHQFPDFEGYSFGEDAYLTHRAWREAKDSGGKMFFLSEPEFEHRSIQSGVKANRFHLGMMTICNQQRIAREAMGKSRCEVFWKSLLHRGFVTVALMKTRRPGWVGEVAGIWSAR